MKVAITGGSRGIGRGIAGLFQKQGWTVAVCSRSSRDPGLSSKILHWKADVRLQGEMEHFVAGACEALGGLDAFVNCAGVSRWRPLEKIDPDFIRELIETNVLGSLWGCQSAARVLGKGGSIVNVSSLAGKRGSANNAAYCASKFAVNGVTQSLAKELGPRGIRVNAVCPVYVETEAVLTALAEKDSPARGKPAPVYLEEFARTQTALGRLPTEEEVAQAVAFLAGSAASGITGQCINVDCGTLPQ